MLYILQTALELGLLYAPVALALFLSYRILDIADLTTDGAFTLGAGRVGDSVHRRPPRLGGSLPPWLPGRRQAL